GSGAVTNRRFNCSSSATTDKTSAAPFGGPGHQLSEPSSDSSNRPLAASSLTNTLRTEPSCSTLRITNSSNSEVAANSAFKPQITSSVHIRSRGHQTSLSPPIHYVEKFS